MENIITVNTKMYKADGSEISAKQQILVEKEIAVKVIRKKDRKAVIEDTEKKEQIEQIEKYNIVCTKTNIKELVVGRLFSKKVIRGLDDIVDLSIVQNDEVTVMVEDIEIDRSAKINEKNENYSRRTEFKEYRIGDIWKLIEEFSKGSEIHNKTKSAHSCFLLKDGEIVFECEDISRHNAIDKAIGYILINRINPESCIIYTSGRVPLDMITKVSEAGIPVLVAKAVPTDRAVQYANENKIVLIARARRDSFEVFSD